MFSLCIQNYRECHLCPWDCAVDRTGGELGFCGAGSQVKVNDYLQHFGEEACLVSEGGSGAVFFSHCTLRCRFCQTHEMSWRGEGTQVNVERLAEIFLWLQQEGSENLNLITPGHFLPHVVLALQQARSQGLHLPVVYNTSGFEKVEVLRALEGLIDIYLPDFKFWTVETARELCGAENYAAIARAAIREMHRQVGDLVMDEKGRAVTGVLVRHLIIPGYFEESRSILTWLARDLSINTYVNLMGHYRPCHLAKDSPPIHRSLSREEYQTVLQWAQELGLNRLDATHQKLYELIWRRD